MQTAIRKVYEMTDREIVAALLARDREITEAFFYRKCYPLFKSCFNKYYTDCETCLEFINEIYLYLMLPKGDTQQSYMQRFSFHLALSTARHRMRQHPKFSSPYYWAAFIAVD